MVGKGVGISVGSGVEVAEVEQDVNKMASKPRPVLSEAEGPEKSRGILSKGKVEAIGKLSHRLSQKRIQVCIPVFEHLFGDRR